MSTLTLKPFIDELESFNSITDQDLRKAELFWVRQLIAWGFTLMNNDRPFNDDQPCTMKFSDSEISYLEQKRKYIPIIKHVYNIKISAGFIGQIIERGSCLKPAFTKVQFLIEKLKELDYSKIVIKRTIPMFKMNEAQSSFIKTYINEDITRAEKVFGVCRKNIYRLRNLNLVRYDRYYKILELMK